MKKYVYLTLAACAVIAAVITGCNLLKAILPDHPYNVTPCVYFEKFHGTQKIKLY